MKERPLSPTGFEHDRPYMKLDIWEEGEIERKWGHDPATYPNVDLLQHYPTVQFNPSLSESAKFDANLNAHTLQRQTTRQTSRPGFVNTPVAITHNVLAVGVAESNSVGIEHAVANNIPTVVKIEDLPADPTSKAATIRPGFVNKPVAIEHDSVLAVSTRDSNEVGLSHAVENNIPVKPGYQEDVGSAGAVSTSVTDSSSSSSGTAKDTLVTDSKPTYDGTIATAQAVENEATKVVESLF